MHAAWNFLLKRAGGSQVALAQSKLVEAVLFAPVFVYFAARTLPATGVVVLLVGVASTGVLANYMSLAAAYRHGDLSFVYPIARGAALAMLPAFGWVFLGERLTVTSAIAIVVIVAGIIVLQLPALTREGLRTLAGALRAPATRYALLAALTTAGYTIWDKHAIRQMDAFAYMYLYTAVVAVLWGGWTWRHTPAEERRATWQAHRVAIIAIGALNMGSYFLTLLALRTDASSLVIGLRQLSIVFGVLLGAWLLGERLSRPRVLGVGLIAAGCLLIAFA